MEREAAAADVAEARMIRRAAAGEGGGGGGGRSSKAKRKRGRVELRRIEDRTSRQVRFSKRRSGLFKKAYELSVLCDADVALLVFSPAGRLYEFTSSNSSIEEFFCQYWDYLDTTIDLNIEARDPWIACNSQLGQKEQSAAVSLHKLNPIVQCVLESEINELNIDELRGLEEAMSHALEVTKNKLTMKLAGGLAAQNRVIENPTEEEESLLDFRARGVSS
ncbi:hypothetical protein GUJ93_ZPchr0008g11652 [Zizania palustris]|uniref:MADS-box domain-containing protein n=1 Tax=Zizania palustris TaxID=103762 RepID=A0A8J5UX93_ZIZPA|nr:hypothetical protein GUJ93_ZPchr0008g11652 [Zizania palustris]